MNELLLPFSLRAAIDITAEQCGQVIRDEQSVVTNQELVQNISDLAGAGITVRFVSVQSIADEGYSDVTDYVNDTLSTCQWNENDQIIITISSDPRQYDVYSRGTADESFMDTAQDILADGLKDDDTSFQADAADALQYVESELIVVVEQPGVDNPVSQPTATTEQPKDSLDIPYVPIAGGLTGVGLLAAGAVFIKNRKEFNSAHKKMRSDVSSQMVKVFDTFDAANGILSILPSEDALELRLDASKLTETGVNLKLAAEAAEVHIATNGRRFWRRRQAIADAYQIHPDSDNGDLSLSVVLRSSTEISDEVARATEKLKNSLDTIDETVAGYAAQLQKFVGVIELLQSKGYETSALQPVYQTFQDVNDEVAALREQRFIVKPTDIIEAQQPKLREATAEIEAIPDWHNVLEKRREVFMAAVPQRKSELTTAQDTVKAVQSDFDTSCFGSLQETLAHLMQTNEILQTKMSTLVQEDSTKNIAELKEREVRLGALDDVKQRFANQSEDIMAWHKKLIDLKATLPQVALNQQQSVAELVDAIAGYGDDVEPETLAQAKNIMQLAQQINTDVAVQKPRYLEIEERLDTVQRSVADATSQANAERQEMIDLREEVQSESIQLANSIRSGKMYLNSNRSDIDLSSETSILQAELFNGNPKTRIELRQAVAEIATLQKQISNAVASAERDVAEAEAVRERERQRLLAIKRAEEKAEERREEARRDAASASSRSNDFTGGNSKGSHRSGDF